jgi:hypothetical protein
MIRAPIVLRTPTLRQFAASYILDAAPDNCVVHFKEETRTLEQNAKMWAMLDEIAQHVEWRDWQGRPIQMQPEEWKDFLWATFKKDQRMVMGEDGRSFVLVREGSGTSKAGVREMAEFITFIEAFGVTRNVPFKDDAPVSIASLRK